MLNPALFANELSVLRVLTGFLAEPDLKWETLHTHERRSIAATHFLLDSGHDGVEHFMTRLLPKIMRQLNSHMEAETREFHGEIRGRIVWPATIKARLDQSHDPSRFVCREVHKRYQTPENELLKHLLASIESCLRHVPDFIRLGASYTFGDAVFHEAQTVDERLNRIETMLVNLERDIVMRAIEAPDRVSEFHLLRAKTSRMEEYAAVALLYERYINTAELLSWPALSKIGRQTLLLPENLEPEPRRWLKANVAMMRSQLYLPHSAEVNDNL